MNKLMIFGDSIFKGITYSDENKKYSVYKHSFSGKLAQIGIITENYSRMGATASKISAMLDSKTGSIDSDTAVLFEFGGNDSDFDWNKVSEDPDGALSPNTSNNDFIIIYRKLIEKVRDLGANVIISNLVPIDADKYLKWITAGKSYDNIMKFLGDASILYRWQEYYSITVERIADETDCPVLDIRRNFLISHTYKSLLCSDGLHPTAAGHVLIDNTIFNYIKNHITNNQQYIVS